MTVSPDLHVILLKLALPKQEPPVPAAAEPAQKRGGFFSNLFGRGSSGDAAAAAALVPPAAAAAGLDLKLRLLLIEAALQHSKPLIRLPSDVSYASAPWRWHKSLHHHKHNAAAQ
jgi:hypothetical protein